MTTLFAPSPLLWLITPAEAVWVPGVWVAGAVWFLCAFWWWFVGVRIVLDRLKNARVAPPSIDSLRWWGIMCGAAGLWISIAQVTSAGVVAISWMAVGSILVDARVHKLPDPFTVVMALGVLVALVLQCWHDGGFDSAGQAGLGLLVWVVPFGLGKLFKTGMGLGDVKLAPVLGAMLGLVSFQCALSGLLLTFLGAGIMAIVLMIRRQANRNTRLAMGPWMLGASLSAWALWTLPTISPVALGC